MNRQRRPTTAKVLAVIPSTSMPNLRGEMSLHGNGDERFNRDFNFNPADFLPRDDFPENIPERYCSDWLHLFYFALKVSAVLILFTCIIAYVHDYILKPPSSEENCDLNCMFDVKNKEIKFLQTKLSMMDEELRDVKLSLEKVLDWRTNLEYEMSKVYSKTMEEHSYQLVSIEKKIEEALSLYDADKIGMIDYALESAGGSIVSISSTTPYPSKITYELMGVVSLHSTSNPRLMIQPGNLPGQCFAFHGQTGIIRLKLAQAVQISSVTLEHAHPSLVLDITSCPKDFRVYGLDEPDGQILNDLGQFTYNLKGKTLQTFDIDRKHKERYEFIEVHILSNYGHSDYTCIYRFRVHSNI